MRPEIPMRQSLFGNKRDWLVAVRSVTAVCSITYKKRNHAIQQLVFLFIDEKYYEYVLLSTEVKKLC